MITRLLFSAFVCAMPLTMLAQDDDLYFVPKKQTIGNSVANELTSEYNHQPYYCGSSRDVDEYNRRGKLKSYYQKIGTDSLGNDIIEFHEGDGTYGTADLDSTITIYPGSERYYDDDDFKCARRMGRFDGYYDPALYSWSYPYSYWRGYYGWYDPWYDPFYSPYYAGWYGGWYSPWRYDYWGWNYPYWGWSGWHAPIYHYSYNGPTGTRNHSFGGFGTAVGRSGSYSPRYNGMPMDNANRRSHSWGNSRNGFGQRRNYNQSSNNNQPFTNQNVRQPVRSNNFGSNRGSSFGSGFGGGFGGGGRVGGFGGGSRGGGFGSRR